MSGSVPPLVPVFLHWVDVYHRCLATSYPGQHRWLFLECGAVYTHLTWGANALPIFIPPKNSFLGGY